MVAKKRCRKALGINFLFQTTVERKLINILDAVETLSSNIAKKKISLMRRTYRSVQNYSTHDRINVSHENLGKYDSIRP